MGSLVAALMCMCTIVRCVVEENVGIIGGELGRGKIVFGIGLGNKLEYGVAIKICHGACFLVLTFLLQFNFVMTDKFSY